jgi:hypothetical protein
VLTRQELLSLLSDVFAAVPGNGGPKLLDEIKTLLANRGSLEMTVRVVTRNAPPRTVAWVRQRRKGGGLARASTRSRVAATCRVRASHRCGITSPGSYRPSPSFLPQPEDIWYSMPVGEIDFSACPRCTPSYRALPAGYPKLACSERSRMEIGVSGGSGGPSESRPRQGDAGSLPLP